MKTNQRSLLLAICICACMIGGCEKASNNSETSRGAYTASSTYSNQGDSTDEKKKEPSEDIVDREDEHIKVHATINVPSDYKSGQVPVATGNVLPLVENIDELKEIFFSPNTDPVVNIREENNALFSIVDKENSIGLGYNDGGDFVYNTKKFNYYLNSIVTNPMVDGYNADKYQTIDNLSFQSKEEASQSVRDFFRKYGISLGNSIKAYVCDYQTLQNESDTEAKGGGVNKELEQYKWSSTDDVYYFFFHQEFEGYPMLHNMYRGQGFETGSEATVMYGENGIVGAAIIGCYKWTEKERVSVITAETAIDTFVDHYKGIVDIYYEVNQISLMLDIISRANVQAELKPVWVLNVKVTGTDYSYDDVIVIDAVNGKEISV